MLEPNINLLPDDLQSKERFKSDLKTESKPNDADETGKEQKRKTSVKKTESVFRRFGKEIKKLTRAKKKQMLSPEKSGTELLTEEVLGPRSVKRELIQLGGIVFAFVLLFFGVYEYYEWRIQKVQTATRAAQEENVRLDGEIARARKDLDSSKQAADIVAAIDAILQKRTDWNAILARLESFTLKTVYYTGFRGEGDGTIELTARAKTLEDALLQIKILKNAGDFVSSVDVDEFSLTQEKITIVGEANKEGVAASFVEFPLSITLADDWFYDKTKGN